MMRHDESLMWQYAANELEPGEAKLVELHLEECPECQDRLQAVEFARETLSDAKDAVPEVRWNVVDERIGAVVERRLSSQARRPWIFRGALVTALAAAAVAAFALYQPAVELPKPAIFEPVVAMVTPPPLAKVEHAEGLTLVTETQTVLADGARLHSGDVLRTALAGRAFVHLPDASHLRVGAATQLSLTRSERDDVALTLEKGRLAVKASHAADRRGFVVHSGGLTVNVLGTTFAVANSGDGVEVSVSEGRVRVETEKGETTFVAAGQRMHFDARTSKAHKLGLSPSVKQELAEVTAAADAVTAVETIAAAPTTPGPLAANVPARGGMLPRLEPREARSRQATLPSEALAAADSTPEVPLQKRERVLGEPGDAFPSLAGGATKGLPPKWQESIDEQRAAEQSPQPDGALDSARAERVQAAAAPAPIPGGPMTMVVPTLPPERAATPDATREWVAPPDRATSSGPTEWSQLPATQPAEAPQVVAQRATSRPEPAAERARPAGIAKDVESIFLGRAETSLEKGSCERYLVGLEEIALDTEKNDRTERARVIRARCFDISLRPRQAMSEYRKYLDEYPVGRFITEARDALGQ